MTEEEIMDVLAELAMEWALGEEPTGTTAEVTDTVEVDPVEWVTKTSGTSPDRAFVVNILLDYADVGDEAEVEGDRFQFAYGADYPLIEPDYDEDEGFDDEEVDGTEEENG
jgi:hypothetical protein